METIYSHPTIGFGVPDVWEPHYYCVTVPRRENRYIFIEEVLAGPKEIIPRASLERTYWGAISDPLQKEFNKRLKEQDLARSRWKVGENPVDRLLGKELCVLAWAIEEVDSGQIGIAVRNWLALRPEERWWLFGMATKDTCWRIALRHALAS